MPKAMMTKTGMSRKPPLPFFSEAEAPTVISKVVGSFAKSMRQSGRNKMQVTIMPTTARGSEEAGTYLQTNGHDKEDKTELLDDMQHLGVEVDATGTESDSHKEHPCDALRNLGNLDFAQ